MKNGIVSVKSEKCADCATFLSDTRMIAVHFQEFLKHGSIFRQIQIISVPTEKERRALASIRQFPSVLI